MEPNETQFEVIAIFPDPMSQLDIKQVLGKYIELDDVRLDKVPGPFFSIVTIDTPDQNKADEVVTMLRDDDSVISVGIIKPSHRLYQLELEFDQYVDGMEETVASLIGWEVQEMPMHNDESYITATYGSYAIPYESVLIIKETLAREYPTFKQRWRSPR